MIGCLDGLKFVSRDADLVFMMEGFPDEDVTATATGCVGFISGL
jgi:hypothetical protein